MLKGSIVNNGHDVKSSIIVVDTLNEPLQSSFTSSRAIISTVCMLDQANACHVTIMTLTLHEGMQSCLLRLYHKHQQAAGQP